MFCWNCGVKNDDGAVECQACGKNLQDAFVPPPAEDDVLNSAGMRILLPVGRSVYAIIAGYLGLVSVLLFPAPFAAVFGLLALRDIRNDPTKHGMGRAIFGLVMGLIFSAVLVVVILGGAIGR